MRKYKFKKGENILDTHLRYVCDGGYRGKHRYVVVSCELCGSIKNIRLDAITSKKVKACGCLLQELIETGKLNKYSIKARKDKPYLQRGGRSWREGYAIVITKDTIEHFTDHQIAKEIVDFIRRETSKNEATTVQKG